MRNRVRLPFYLSKAQFPVERNVFRLANGESKMLSAIVRHTYEGKTDYIPEDWHRKLLIALAHDTVTIEDARLLTDVVLDGDYSIDWQEFLNNPVAQSNFTIQTTPFNATNSNCQTCEEITQLELVDDYTDVVWEEGTTNEYPDLITANDNICCFPFLIEIMWFDTDFFDSVTVDQSGVLTVVVKNAVQDRTDLLVCTYRVTCENGGYDEANVYGNISGSVEACEPPYGVSTDGLDPSGTSIDIDWFEPVPPPAGGYDWAIYRFPFIAAPFQSGNVTGDTLHISSLLSGVNYMFTIRSNCGGGEFSTLVTATFDTPRPEGNNCGMFRVTYVPDESIGIQSASYMDCNGNIQTHTFPGAGTVDLCMLINDGEEVPVFYAASTEEVKYLYLDLC